MASGFIILSDGRCLARRWTFYDLIFELVIEVLSADQDQDELKIAFCNWLRTQIPSSEDIECGYCFIRPDGENVVRHFDLRELTPGNQEIFWKAIQRILIRDILQPEKDEYDLIRIKVFKIFLRMKKLADRLDHPDNLSDWRKGYTEPPSGERVGPGW
ncbi:hypothetical protein [Paraflavitalea pollutisoli]|uniref:hypothetical protein n=1 Tax=Paraflavitalea pollutisoli TaxID=3034143 RepID=UPI0023EAB2F6|nr:hypothetical protein [Paraflavitalea sp. H1-2-19X]